MLVIVSGSLKKDLLLTCKTSIYSSKVQILCTSFELSCVYEASLANSNSGM